MAFCYLPRSTDTIFLVVYGPNRALEGLQGVGFQGKNCFTRLVPNFSKINFGFSKYEKMNKKYYYGICYLPRSTDTFFLVVYEPYRVLEGLRDVEFQGKNCLTKLVSNIILVHITKVLLCIMY